MLARRAGEPKTDALLHRLLHRAENTLVPHEVAEAVAAAARCAGSGVVARAIAEADHRDLDHHWMLDAVESVWMQNVEHLRVAQSLCAALMGDVDPSVVSGARELLDFTTTGKRP